MSLRMALAISVATALTAAGCNRGGSVSKPEAIVDATNAHAFGLLAVRTFAPGLKKDENATGGRAWAQDVVTDMPHYALVECLPAAGKSAPEWYSYLEARSFMIPSELYVDLSTRELGFRVASNDKLDAAAPCRVVNDRLVTAPVLFKALLAPYDDSMTVTEGIFRLAQSIYLSVRGSYDVNDPEESSRLAFLPLQALVRAHDGALAIAGGDFIDKLLTLDADFNPCVRDASKAKLTGDARDWRTKYFDCVKHPAVASLRNYRPKTQTYDTLRDQVGHEIDALHDRLYKGNGVALTETRTPRDEIFDEVTNMRRKLDVADLGRLIAAVGGDYVEERAAVGGLGLSRVDEAATLERIERTERETPPALPSAANPFLVTQNQALLQQSASPSGVQTGLGRIINNQQSTDGLEAFRRVMANRTGTAIVRMGRLRVATELADQQLLDSIRVGQASNLVRQPTADSRFVDFANPEGNTRVSIDRQTGAAFVLRSGSVAGVTGNQWIMSNMPHSGTDPTNIAANEVGSFITPRTADGHAQIGVHVPAVGNSGNGETIRFQLNCPTAGGGCTIPCNNTQNTDALNRLNMAITREDLSAEQRSALLATSQNIQAMRECAGARLLLADCSGATPATDDQLGSQAAGEGTSTTGTATATSASGGEQTAANEATGGSPGTAAQGTGTQTGTAQSDAAQEGAAQTATAEAGTEIGNATNEATQVAGGEQPQMSAQDQASVTGALNTNAESAVEFQGQQELVAQAQADVNTATGAAGGLDQTQVAMGGPAMDAMSNSGIGGGLGAAAGAESVGGGVPMDTGTTAAGGAAGAAGMPAAEGAGSTGIALH